MGMSTVELAVEIAREILQAKECLAACEKKLEDLLGPGPGPGPGPVREVAPPPFGESTYPFRIRDAFTRCPIDGVLTEEYLLKACSIPGDKLASFRSTLSRLVTEGHLIKPGIKLYQLQGEVPNVGQAGRSGAQQAASGSGRD